MFAIKLLSEERRRVPAFSHIILFSMNQRNDI